MRFVHNSPDWEDLLRIVAESTNRDVGMVEKDYWVAHTLWALHEQGFNIWFKGGTSLSKGFELIERFSEDIDVCVESGSSGLTDPKLSWSNMKSGIAERDVWFEALTRALRVPDCTVERDPDGSDAQMRSACIPVQYPALHNLSLPVDMSPFVLLEVGRARVVPFVPRDLSSWVHDHLVQIGAIGEFIDNRPRGVRCVHPWVTCLEKLEAIARKFERAQPAPKFVRHYEDVAHILGAWGDLPSPNLELSALVETLAHEDKKRMPLASHPAFDVGQESARWHEIEQAWTRIGPMFWGPRMDLPTACAMIRTFLASLPAA